MTNIKVLVVEDVSIAQKLTKLLLNKAGCDVDIANTGEKAIALSIAKKYDLIFMDLGLPDIDGLSVTEKIRNAEGSKNKQVPIIALTAHTKNNCKKECDNVGINYILEKPLTEKLTQLAIHKFIKT